MKYKDRPHRPYDTVEIFIRWLLLLVTIVGLIGVYAALKLQKVTLSEGVLIAIILFFVSERVSDIIVTYASRSRSIFLQNSINVLSTLIQDSADLIVFERPADAMNYIQSNFQRARRIQDTFFRSSPQLSYSHSPDADRYMKSLVAAINAGCRFTGILTDMSVEMQEIIRQKAKRNYQLLRMDHRDTPLLNITLIDFYGGEKSVLFGWDYESLDEGYVFATSSKEAYDYFTSYYRALKNDAVVIEDRSGDQVQEPSSANSSHL